LERCEVTGCNRGALPARQHAEPPSCDGAAQPVGILKRLHLTLSCFRDRENVFASNRLSR